jgi:precorrin-6B C5,15-methyltransferase / cobalt-precorrin-6B C5,C15-methyltransferase
MTAWITVIGIGADGLSGLSENALEPLRNADLLVGGERHQGMVTDSDLKSGAERLTWSCGIASAMDEIATWRSKFVVVLASGDPLYFGAGSTLARHFDSADINVIPYPGAFSLACARMVWSIPNTTCMTVHGRAHESLNLHIRPDANIVALSWNGESPAKLAQILNDRGFGPSPIAVFSDMGTADEQRFDGTAQDWPHAEVPDLNTVCIQCVASGEARWWPRTSGLPEDAFEHDSQITKREVRAATLSALAPMPGEMLWDVGAGCGSVSIEWLRSTDGTSAIAIERHQDRLAFIAANAGTLGVPRLEIVAGEAPSALGDLKTPDAIFVGGGVSDASVLEACWDRLAPDGRMVANAVTLEAQQVLMEFGSAHDATYTRMSVARSGPVGNLTTLRPMMDVLQMMLRKN